MCSHWSFLITHAFVYTYHNQIVAEERCLCVMFIGGRALFVGLTVAKKAVADCLRCQAVSFRLRLYCAVTSSAERMCNIVVIMFCQEIPWR